MYSLGVFTVRYNECYCIANNNWIGHQDVTYNIVIQVNNNNVNGTLIRMIGLLPLESYI